MATIALTLAAGQQVLVAAADLTADPIAEVLNSCQAAGATATVWADTALFAQRVAGHTGAKFDAAVVMLADSDDTDEAYAALVELVREGGQVLVLSPASAEKHEGDNAAKDLADVLLLSGLSIDESADVARDASGKYLVAHATVPLWSGEAAALPKPAVAAAGVAGSSTTTSSARAVWASLATDFNDDAHDLEDEDALLVAAAPVLPAKKGVVADCGSGPRKRACKNCTCGAFLPCWGKKEQWVH
jgi:hypothetical protein